MSVEALMRRAVVRPSNRVVSVLTQILYDDTPKDTTLAASNWIVGDRPASSPRGVQPPALARNEGRVFAQNRTRPDDIYVTNRVSYIGDLNRGDSPQAPARFVQNAMAIALDVATR